MKIKQTSKKRNIITLGTIITVLILAGLGYFIVAARNHSNTPQSNSTSSGSPVISEEIKQKADSPSTTQSTSKEPVQSTDSANKTTTPANTATVTITALNQSDNNLQIRTLINELWSDGQCTLTLSKDSSTPISKTVKTQPLANQSTCAGFDISTSQMDKGLWSVKVTATKADKSATATKEIDIK